MIIGYTRRMARSRTWRRTIVSKTFTMLINMITGRRLQYYNGLQIHQAAVLKSLRIESSGYGFQPEVLIKSLRLTGTFLEVPMDLIERKQGESKAFPRQERGRCGTHAAGGCAHSSGRPRRMRRPCE